MIAYPWGPCSEQLHPQLHPQSKKQELKLSGLLLMVKFAILGSAQMVHMRAAVSHLASVMLSNVSLFVADHKATKTLSN